MLAWLAAPGAQAAPADDHARGLKAYHRGDVVDAMNALRPAVQAGYAPAQTLLAFILERSDFAEEAVALYRSAADQGDAEGHAGLANAYLSGRGVAKDEKRALQHFSKAADAGHAPSVEVIATAWAQGDLGLQAGADPAAARAALQRAAAQGHLASAEALAVAYQKGRLGQAPDPAEATRWQQRVAELRQQRVAKAAPTASR
jgi:hypothetical protein